MPDLAPINRLLGMAVSGAGPRFDLHKQNLIAISGDEVYFTVSGIVIASDYFESLPAEIIRGQVLSVFSQFPIVSLHQEN